MTLKSVPRITIVAIGDELLDGRIADLNIRFLGAQLRERGGALTSAIVVDDDVETIAEAVRRAARQSDLVVTSGGLGPTSDDRTVDGVARAARAEVREDSDALDRLVAKYTARNRPMAATNRRQARFPVGATVLPSRFGTADAFETPVADTPVISLPGVPREFRGLVAEYVLPRVPNDVGQTRLTLRVVGRGESDVAEAVESAFHNQGVHVTYRASFPTVHVGLSGPEENVNRLADELRARLRPWLLCPTPTSPTEALADVLIEREWTIGTAESCTGGLLASTLTDLSGSSRYFMSGWVTYANAAKMSELDVARSSLEQLGAVSGPVAAQMAVGVRAAAGVDVALSTTGIAGPTGGTATKPVGTVYLGVVTPEGGRVVHAVFRGVDRSGFKARTVMLAQMAALRACQERWEDIHHIYGVESVRPLE